LAIVLSLSRPSVLRCTCEPIEAAHIARQIDAAKMRGDYGASLALVAALTR
jgi:hypothetical protein